MKILLNFLFYMLMLIFYYKNHSRTYYNFIWVLLSYFAFAIDNRNNCSFAESTQKWHGLWSGGLHCLLWCYHQFPEWKQQQEQDILVLHDWPDLHSNCMYKKLKNTISIELGKQYIIFLKKNLDGCKTTTSKWEVSI